MKYCTNKNSSRHLNTTPSFKRCLRCRKQKRAYAQSEQNRQYRAAYNKTSKAKSACKRWRLAHPNYEREWRARNRERSRKNNTAYARKWRKANSARHLNTRKLWRLHNLERCRKLARARYWKHREKHLKAMKVLREKWGWLYDKRSATKKRLHEMNGIRAYERTK